MAMDEVIWGIVGCGAVTEVKAGPAFSRVAGSRLAAVMRRDPHKARDYARRHDVPRWYNSLGDLLRDPEVNAIYIATPTNSHCELTLQALASGRPVLVEKPMALNASEATRMVNAAERADRPLFVAYYKRALPRLEALRHVVQSGELGPARCAVATHMRPRRLHPRQAWKLDPAINGGGLFVDAQVHTLDWLDHCFGPPRDAQALVRSLSSSGVDDLVTYSLGWDAGQVASGTYCFGAGPRTDNLTIYAAKGSVSTAILSGGELVVRWDDGEQELRPYADPPHVHEPLIARVVEHLRGGRPAPSSGYDGLRTTQLVDRLYAGFRSQTRRAAPA